MPDTSEFGPWPSLAYVRSKLDRAAERRGDGDFIAAASKQPDACTVVIGGELVVLRRQGTQHDSLFKPSDAAAFGTVAEQVFLGLADGAPRFGYGIALDAAETLKARTDLHVTDLRSVALQGLVPAEQLPPLAAAKAVLSWHARHRFCSHCGVLTRSVEAGWRRDCAACGVQHFPRTDPCVIMLVIDGERCLLARSARFASGMWSCLAGFVEPGESIEEAVQRETREEAGIGVGRVRYFASQPWPFPMSLMIGCFAEAAATELRIDRAEIEDVRWVERAEAVQMLAREHPDGIFAPHPFAIAHHLMRAYVEHGADVFTA
jgi:NAD+ diphosphatase